VILIYAIAGYNAALLERKVVVLKVIKRPYSGTTSERMQEIVEDWSFLVFNGVEPPSRRCRT